MSISINANQIYASIRDRGQTQADSWAGQARSYNAPKSKSESSPTSARALEYQQRTQQKNNKSVVDQSQSYADSLRASRTKAKETNLEKKKLQYSYKKISSQIVRSKTSVSARKAASAARREVLRLKRLRASGEYDEEELQISIEHAKSMERIAKKKVAHLQQEEMIERGQNGAMAALEEKEEQTEEKELEEEPIEDEPEDQEYADQEYLDEMQIMMADMQDEMAFRMEELSEEMELALQEIAENSRDSMDEMMSDMMKMVQDAMEEMDEVLELDELANTMVAPDPNMSEDDLKMLKMKHRTKEMKDIAKADGEYLKAIMDKYEKKGVAGTGLSGAASNTPAFSGAAAVSSSPEPIKVSVPAAYNSGAASMSFDAFA